MNDSPMFPLYPDTVNLYLLFSSLTANLEYSAWPFSPENLWRSTRSFAGLSFVSWWMTSLPMLTKIYKDIISIMEGNYSEKMEKRKWRTVVIMTF